MTPPRLTLFVILCLTGLSALYHYADLEATHAARFASALTALRLHDAEFNRDLLRLRRGDLLHYDSVNHTIRTMASDSAVLAAFADDLAPEVAVLGRLVQHKEEQLEVFKSTHALVRNSLAYILHRQDTLADRHPAIVRLGGDLLQFLQHPNERHRSRILAFLGSTAERPPFPSLQRHVRLILEYLPRLEAVTADLLATPVAAVTARLATLHHTTLTRLQQRADRFRLGLFLSAVGFLAYLLLSLARLHRANRRLEQEMRHRLETERQLLQAQKMEALGTLASGIAHDFNNLLTGMRGYVALAREQLEEGHPPENALTRLETIVLRGQELTRRLLQFARPGGNDTSETFTPGTVVAEAMDFIRPALPRGVRLDFEDRLPADHQVTGCATELQQIVVNLVRNAADAIAGQGRIEVILEPEGDGIDLLVRDDGKGIDPEQIPKIFEPFASGRQAGIGTGLGLAIVRRIAEHHGGRVTVASRPGRGTTFTVHLPAYSLQP